MTHTEQEISNAANEMTKNTTAILKVVLDACPTNLPDAITYLVYLEKQIGGLKDQIIRKLTIQEQADILKMVTFLEENVTIIPFTEDGVVEITKKQRVKS